MKGFFRLIRWKNILVVALTMVAMRQFIICPVFGHYCVDVMFPTWGFYMMMMATMLIAAGGNVINDYYDLRIDRINKPDKMIIGVKISRRRAIAMHLWLNIFGLAFGILAAVAARIWWYVLIFVAAAFFLWIYSLKFKKITFWGNFVIAVLTAIVPFLVGMTEYFAVEKSLVEWDYAHIQAVKMSMQVIVAFSIFAFIYTLLREIIKDCEDIAGDSENNVRSIPVVLGLKKTRYVISIVALVASAMVYLFWHFYLRETSLIGMNIYAAIYLMVFVELPSLVLVFLNLFKDGGRKFYSAISKAVKLIMLFGLLFTLIFSFIVYHNGIF